MEFTRVGKTYQMVINTGKDLEDVLVLDEALWGATSAPANAFRADPELIKILDPAATGRITSNALKDAIRWLLAQLPKHDEITKEFNGSLQLKDIDASTPVGKALVNSANYILAELKAENKEAITLQQIRNFLDTVAKRPLNGDGVLSLAAAGPNIIKPEANDNIKNLITDTIAATGGTPDLDGTQGASEKNFNDFLAAAKEYLAWKKQGEIPEGQDKTDLMPFGPDTPALSALSQQHAPQVDNFFKLCDLLAFDQRLVQQALGPDNKAAAFDPAKQEEVVAYINGLPFSEPVKEAKLTLDANKINPLYKGWWQQVIDKLVKPILGDGLTEISRQDWAKIRATFAPYEAYLAAKKGASVEKVPADKLQAYLDNPNLVAETQELLNADKAVAETVKAAKEVEKLLLLRASLLRIVNNFVSFPELYDGNTNALFECGELVIDGRWFNVSFAVDAVPAHMAIAKTSLLCLLYAEIDKGAAGKFNVVVPVTFGTQGNLAVGKRGVFFDLDGKEYDAKIVQIITNPICVSEALFAPFSKLWNIVEGKIEAWSGSAEKKLQADFTKAITPPAPGAAPAPAPAPAAAPAAGAKPGDKSGMFLGVSVAIAALGSAFAFISKTLAGMTGLQIIITIACAILILMLPVSILAIIKLNKQDLSTVLEGSGWAINLRMRLTAKLRGQFTNFGKYPKDAIGTPKRKVLRYLIIILLIAIIGYTGKRIYSRYKAAKAEKAAVQEVQQAPTPPVDPANPAEAPAAPAPAPAAPAPAPAAK